jgi:ATP/maltotriose-dependent transcriptional regulator MalT
MRRCRAEARASDQYASLLATLYHDRGDLKRAIRTLEESERLCADHGIVFDGEDLLDEYSRERASLKVSKSLGKQKTRPSRTSRGNRRLTG